MCTFGNQFLVLVPEFCWVTHKKGSELLYVTRTFFVWLSKIQALELRTGSQKCTCKQAKYGNRPGAKVVCFGGTKTFEGTPTQPVPDAFGMRQQSGEYFAPNPMLSSFVGVSIFVEHWGWNHKNKRASLQNLTYLITTTWSVLLFLRKVFVVTCFGQKFAGPLALV